MPDIRFIQPALSLLAAATMWYSSAAAAWQDGSDVAVRCIWEKAPHSAFTDLLQVDGELYCTFREGEHHVHGADGTIRVLHQLDDGSFESIARIAEDGVDLRDPKLSLTPDGRIMLLYGGSFYKDRVLQKRECRVAFSNHEKTSFDAPKAVLIDEQIRSSTDWLWRVTWHDGIGYGVVYQPTSDPGVSRVHLVETSDGVHYQLLKTLPLDGGPNETTLRFTDTGRMVGLFRREGPGATAAIGNADPPYLDWNFAPLPIRLGGPELMQLPDQTWLAAGRDYSPEGTRTVVGRVGLDGSWQPLHILPSGGDTSYPGMVCDGNRVVISYYSSHQGNSAIYLADIPVPRINFVVIFCDDLGYGDLGCYGHPTIQTPNLDRMAQEGQLWTDFYCAAPVCTPSRAALLTGRLPIRNGMCSNTRRVLFPDSGGGIPAEETTIAEALAQRGYATGHFGKWHLGHLPEHLPTRHGFDTYFGIPYSNDMMWAGKNIKRRDAFAEPRSEYWNVPLLRNDEVIEQPAEQTTITKRYTEEAQEFIRQHRKDPFFVYLAHSMPHVPLFRSEAFQGRSRRGIYGDVIEEIDASVGAILATLAKEGLDRNTVVVFTSDNGPWLPYGTHGGSAGLLRGGKGSTFEGGMRVPGIFWGPGIIAPGRQHRMGSTLDLMSTFTSMSGDAHTTSDGVDLSAPLRGEHAQDAEDPRQTMFFYRGEELFAIRHGKYKAHLKTRAGYGQQAATVHDPPLLYDLDVDPSEAHDISSEYPEVLVQLQALANAHTNAIEPVENQLLKRIPKGDPEKTD